MSHRIAVSCALSIVLAACGGEGEPMGPVPLPAAPVAPGPVATTPPTPGVPPGTPLGPRTRTIITRNPLGGPSGNLFIDGDFELSTVPPGGIPQLAWTGYTSDGQGEIAVKAETGGLCRTGLRCGLLEADMVLFGRGAAAANEAGHVASFWAKVPEGEACDVIRGVLVECNTFYTVKKLKADDAPGDDGWCAYGGTLSARESAMCLYIDTSLADGAVALIDAALLIPDDGTVAPRMLEAWVPPPDVADNLRAIGEHMRNRFGGVRPVAERGDDPDR